MLTKNLYANFLDNPLPNVVYLQCHDEKRGRRGGVRGRIMLRPYKKKADCRWRRHIKKARVPHRSILAIYIKTGDYPKNEMSTPAATAEPITPEMLLDIQ